MSDGALLELTGLSKRFGGVVALDEITLEVEESSICGLIGPNGAGKTTLFNVITNVVPASAGAIVFDGRPLLGLRPYAVTRRGLARTFQNIRLFDTLTVEEHLRVGQRRSRESGRAQRRAREELLSFASLDHVRAQPAVELPYGLQRRVEIARALATGPRLLLLDEPAAGMNSSESAALADFVQAVRARGVTILLIDHDMPFVMSLCDHIYVLNFGSLIAQGAPGEVQRNPVVLEAYLGKNDDEAAYATS